MRILVLGATGHLGGNILRSLLARGHECVALIRPGSEWKLDEVDCEISTETDPVNLLQDVPGKADWIVDAAAPYLTAMFVDESLLDQALERTRRIIKAAEQRGASLAHISSFITLPGAGGSLLGRFKRRSSPYYVSKSGMEKLIRRAITRGMKGLVINPGPCMGPFDYKRYEECLVPLIVNQEMEIALDRSMSFVDVRDVAEATVSLMEEGGSRDPVPMIGWEIHASDLANRVSALAGVEPPVPVSVADSVATIGTVGLETMGEVFNLSIPPALVTWLMTESVEHCDKGQFKPVTPIEQTLQDSISWYHRLGYC